MSRSIYDDSDYFYRARAEEGSAIDSFWGQTVMESIDVYVEWVLPPELLTEEVARVTDLFGQMDTGVDVWHASQGQRGDFTYWVMDFLPRKAHDPFGERWEGGMIFVLFAYDEQTGRVRYSAGCERDFWPGYPHFREVEW